MTTVCYQSNHQEIMGVRDYHAQPRTSRRRPNIPPAGHAPPVGPCHVVTQAGLCGPRRVDLHMSEGDDRTSSSLVPLTHARAGQAWCAHKRTTREKLSATSNGRKNLYVDADGFVNLCEKAHVASVLGSCVVEAPATRALLPSDELENHQLSVAKERQRERRSGLDSTS